MNILKSPYKVLRTAVNNDQVLNVFFLLELLLSMSSQPGPRNCEAQRLENESQDTAGSWKCIPVASVFPGSHWHINWARIRPGGNCCAPGTRHQAPEAQASCHLLAHMTMQSHSLLACFNQCLPKRADPSRNPSP